MDEKSYPILDEEKCMGGHRDIAHLGNLFDRQSLVVEELPEGDPRTVVLALHWAYVLFVNPCKLSGDVCWSFVISHTHINDEAPPWYALLGGVAGTVGVIGRSAVL